MRRKAGVGHEKELGGWGLFQEVDSPGSEGGQKEGLLQAGCYRTERES